MPGYAPQLILCDHNIPGFGGPEALALAQRALPDVPFILVTGSLDEETAVAYLKAGATDYILKDRLVRLGPAVLDALTRAGQRQSLRRHERLLHQIIDANPSPSPTITARSVPRTNDELNIARTVKRKVSIE